MPTPTCRRRPVTKPPAPPPLITPRPPKAMAAYATKCLVVAVVALTASVAARAQAGHAHAHVGSEQARKLVDDACAVDAEAKDMKFEKALDTYMGGLAEVATPELNSTIVAALAGTDGCSSEMFRREVARKGVAGVLLLAAVEEIKMDHVDVETVEALLGLDEQDSAGCTPLAKAVKRAAEFDMDVKHPRRKLKEELGALSAARGDAAALAAARANLLAELAVAPIQGGLKYAALIDPAVGNITVSELGKERGEAFAYILPMLPRIEACDKDAGTTIRQALSCDVDKDLSADKVNGFAVRSSADDGIYARVKSAAEKVYTCVNGNADKVDVAARVGKFTSEPPVAEIPGLADDGAMTDD